MDKKSLTEEDIKLRFITPAIVEKAGWQKELIKMEYYFTDGRVIFQGNVHIKYLQPIITQYFIDNKSEIWLLFLIAHSKR